MYVVLIPFSFMCVVLIPFSFYSRAGIKYICFINVG